METEKVTMTESEMQAYVDGLVEEKYKKIEAAKKEVTVEDQAGMTDEKINKLIDESIDARVAAQLKEQAKSALTEIKVPDPDLIEAEKDAKGFKSFGEYLIAVRNHRLKNIPDNRLSFITKDGVVTKSVPIEKATAGHMEIGEDAQGGFLVPEVYRPDLKEIALEQAIVRPNGPMIIPPIRTDSVKIPYVNDTSHASNVFGGVLAYWTAEAYTKTATKPTFGQMELTPHKLAGVTYTSNELLDDSAIAIEPMIKRMFGSAWGYYEDDSFINGTGAGQPMGILNCGCLKAVFRNTVNQVYLEDLAEMYACMLPASHRFAIWVVNPGVLPSLIQMGTGNAAAASGKNLVWISQDMGAMKGIPGTILGRPFFISEKMPAFGSEGDIGYFDMRYYIIFDRQPITIDVSTHIGFLEDETCWRFVLRVDGQCWPQTTLTPKNAGAPVTTISPFVVLAATTS